MHALIASMRPSGELDIESAVDACARLIGFDQLPETMSIAVHAGADVLVDVSPALAPFGDDLIQFLETVRQIGGYAVRIGYFEHCPSRGVLFDEAGEETYRPAHARVVIVGAFGAAPLRARSAGPREWLEALNTMPAGVTVIGLTPFPSTVRLAHPSRRLVRWSEHTNYASVMRLLSDR